MRYLCADRHKLKERETMNQDESTNTQNTPDFYKKLAIKLSNDLIVSLHYGDITDYKVDITSANVSVTYTYKGVCIKVAFEYNDTTIYATTKTIADGVTKYTAIQGAMDDKTKVWYSSIEFNGTTYRYD